MKIYKTIGKYSNHTGTLIIDGKRQSFTLSGGNYKLGIPGRLTTADPKLQHAIERHGDYKKRFILEFDGTKEEIKIPPMPNRNTVQGTVTTEEAANAEMIKNNPPSIEPDIQPNYHNLSDVKDYLVIKIPGLVLYEIKNSKMAIEIAEKHNIKFPNWEKGNQILTELNNK